MGRCRERARARRSARATSGTVSTSRSAGRRGHGRLEHECDVGHATLCLASRQCRQYAGATRRYRSDRRYSHGLTCTYAAAAGKGSVEDRPIMGPARGLVGAGGPYPQPTPSGSGVWVVEEHCQLPDGRDFPSVLAQVRWNWDIDFGSRYREWDSESFCRTLLVWSHIYQFQ